MAKLYTVYKQTEHGVRYWSAARAEWTNVFERDLFTADELLRQNAVEFGVNMEKVGVPKVREVNGKNLHYANAHLGGGKVRTRAPYVFLDVGGEIRRHRNMSDAYQWFKDDSSYLRSVGQAHSAQAFLALYRDQVGDYPDRVFELTCDGKYTSTTT